MPQVDSTMFDGKVVSMVPHEIASNIVNLMIGALNCLYGHTRVSSGLRPSSHQTHALRDMFAKVNRWYDRLSQGKLSETISESFAVVSGQAQQACSTFSADAFDMLKNYGQVDPLKCVSAESKQVLCCPTLLSP